MFPGHTNPKLCISVNAIVVNLCKINEPSKRQLKGKILYNLYNYEKNFKFYLIFEMIEANICFIFKKYYS